jgi:hypothetical protein
VARCATSTVSPPRRFAARKKRKLVERAAVGRVLDADTRECDR